MHLIAITVLVMRGAERSATLRQIVHQFEHARVKERERVLAMMSGDAVIVVMGGF